MDKFLEILGKNNFFVVNTGSDLKIFLEENIEEYIKQISSGCDDMVNPNLSSEFLTRMPELIKTLEQEKKLIFNIISYLEQCLMNDIID